MVVFSVTITDHFDINLLFVTNVKDNIAMLFIFLDFFIRGFAYVWNSYSWCLINNEEKRMECYDYTLISYMLWLAECKIEIQNRSVFLVEKVSTWDSNLILICKQTGCDSITQNKINEQSFYQYSKNHWSMSFGKFNFDSAVICPYLLWSCTILLQLSSQVYSKNAYISNMVLFCPFIRFFQLIRNGKTCIALTNHKAYAWKCEIYNLMNNTFQVNSCIQNWNLNGKVGNELSKIRSVFPEGNIYTEKFWVYKKKPHDRSMSSIFSTRSS